MHVICIHLSITFSECIHVRKNYSTTLYMFHLTQRGENQTLGQKQRITSCTRYSKYSTKEGTTNNTNHQNLQLIGMDQIGHMIFNQLSTIYKTLYTAGTQLCRPSDFGMITERRFQHSGTAFHSSFLFGMQALPYVDELARKGW